MKDKVIKEMKNVRASYTYGFIIRQDSFGEQTVGVKKQKTAPHAEGQGR